MRRRRVCRTAGATHGKCELINSRKETQEIKTAMKQRLLILLMAATAVAASAQTAAKPAAPSATAPKATATAAKPAASTAPAAIKLPPGIPPVRGLRKTAFMLQYQDVKIGTGPDAEPGKLYKVLYTGWRAADGVKFDSSADHRQPLRDKDGKPVLGSDGKPKLDVEQPMPFPQGMGRVIPGFDQGFGGMKVGGKRRLFIPWQLAYGTHAIPERGPDHPGIPAKSDLIFDLELVEVADMPAAPMHPGMGGMGGAPGHVVPMPPNHGGGEPSSGHGVPAAPGAPAAAPTPNAIPSAAKPATAPAPAAPATPATPAAPAAPTAPSTPPAK
jgi:peptidylprolyl isomerase